MSSATAELRHHEDLTMHKAVVIAALLRKRMEEYRTRGR